MVLEICKKPLYSRPFTQESFAINLTKLEESPKYFIGNVEVVLDLTSFNEVKKSNLEALFKKLKSHFKIGSYITRLVCNIFISDIWKLFRVGLLTVEQIPIDLYNLTQLLDEIGKHQLYSLLTLRNCFNLKVLIIGLEKIIQLFEFI